MPILTTPGALNAEVLIRTQGLRSFACFTPELEAPEEEVP